MCALTKDVRYNKAVDPKTTSVGFLNGRTAEALRYSDQPVRPFLILYNYA